MTKHQENLQEICFFIALQAERKGNREKADYWLNKAIAWENGSKKTKGEKKV